MIRIYAQHTQNDDLHNNRDFMTSENTVASPACSRPTLQIMRVSHYSVLVRDYTLDRVLADDSVDPSDVGRCSSVDCRSPLGRTTSERAPTHYSVQKPASLVVAGQWTARVTLQQRNTQHTVQSSGQRISTKGRIAAPPMPLLTGDSVQSQLYTCTVPPESTPPIGISIGLAVLASSPHHEVSLLQSKHIL